MDTNLLINLLNLFNNNQNQSTNSQQTQTKPVSNIPKEILESYPYGQFPTNSTIMGQKQRLDNVLSNQKVNNVSAFSLPNDTPNNDQQTEQQNNSSNSSSINMQTLAPLLDGLKSDSNNPNNILKLFVPLLFKNNPNINGILNLLGNMPNFAQNKVKQESIDLSSNISFENANYNKIDTYEIVK